MAEKNNIWMSVSDLMTGLMVIFMFIAIAYIYKVQQAERQKETMITNYKDTKNAIYKDLTSTFQDEFKQWDMEVGKDLTVRFTNPNVMFALGNAQVTTEFAKILDEFLPQYFEVLLKDKYRHSIKEVRIEGHTDEAPIGTQDPYMGNVYLSQERAANVLAYFRNSKYFNSLNEKDKKQLQYWTTANGLSYGRTLDDDKNETFISGKDVNGQYSRRVEFKIITTSEELIEEIITKIQ